MSGQKRAKLCPHQGTVAAAAAKIPYQCGELPLPLPRSILQNQGKTEVLPMTASQHKMTPMETGNRGKCDP